MAANAAGSSPGEAFDAATPSLIESSAIGFMTAKHSTGLQSGGLVGYSTFFTGYRPEQHNIGRALSLGRVAGKGVALAGRALQHTPLTDIPGAERQLKRLARFDKYGLSVFGSRKAAGVGPEGTRIAGRYDDPVPVDLQRDRRGLGAQIKQAMNQQTAGTRTQRGGASAPFQRNKVNPLQGATLRNFSRGSDLGPKGSSSARNALEGATLREPSRGSGGGFNRAPVMPRGVNTAEELVENARLQAASARGLRPATGATTKATLMGRNVAGLSVPDSPVEGANTSGRSMWYKAMSILGGEGATPDGSSAQSKTIYDEYLDEVVSIADPDSKTKGMNLASGGAGRFVGAAFKGVAIYEGLRLIGQGAAYAAGEGYEAMVETTTRLRRRVGQDESMSGGYFNRAASTERQRAVQTLNENRLDPKTQMMGNEAYMGHRV